MNKLNRKNKRISVTLLTGVAGLALFGSINLKALTTDTTTGSTAPTPTPTPTPTPSVDLTGEAMAKEAALAAAGLTAQDVIFTEVESENEDGVLIYEVEFTASGTRYEFKISASGTVLKSESDLEENDEDHKANSPLENHSEDREHPAEAADDHHNEYED